MSQLAPKPVSWLSPGRLALGKLSILDGNPEMGKSLLTLDLCACVTTGRPLWGGDLAVEPADVVILSSEDSNADTVLPRLQALGADLNRVHYWDCAEDDHLFRLPTNRDSLDGLLERTGAKLVVIDPIVAFLEPSVQIYNDQSVRQALEPLRTLAERYACAILMVRHINKCRHGPAIFRGGGSIGFLAACRMGWLAANDPLDPDKKVLAQVKNNLAPPQPSLAYQIVKQEDGSPRLCWLGPCSWTANQLLAGQRRLFSPADEARAFLLDFLAAGPRPHYEVEQALEDCDFSKATLNRVKKTLKIKHHSRWQGERFVSFWCLPGQEPPPEPIDPACADLEAFLADYRKKYPPRRRVEMVNEE
jgi:putative DNA primase/helicase